MPPIKEFTITRRNLPHWQYPGATYFLTWRAKHGRIMEPDDRTLALNAIRFLDGQKWHVYAAVVMPDHVHALVRPLPLDVNDPAASSFHSLSELTRAVKGYSAYRINRRQGQTGTFWQDESYDHIVRDDRAFEEIWAYIVYNPVKAGLVTMPEEYTWLYQAGRAD